MPIKKVSIVLNTDYPEQEELYVFLTKLANGKKRNSSAFLRTLVDREYQVKREHYLAEVKKAKNPQPTIVKSESGGIKFRLE
jgi:succinyl-CoA synthetase beta subunit